MDDVTNILHCTYKVYMRINTDRKSQRTTVGQKARQADHLAWSEDPPLLRELYSLFPKVVTPDTIDEQNQWMTSQISCIAHIKFTCELTRIENPNEQQLGRKPARLITSPGRRILLCLGNFTLCSLNIHTYIHTYMHTYIHTYIHSKNITLLLAQSGNETFSAYWGLSLLLQLCQNGRSLSSASGTELYNLHSSVPLALLSDRPF
ncbi:hypothetical protein SFRURICE_005770 [Spodoptera frugiperda]|nr:hypothetical protein SFRURICE_005770 [Spodoptera frugiperda]